MATRTYRRLTALAVRAAARRPGAMLSDGDGLYLTVTDTGVASWIFRYRAGTKERYMGLGPLRHVNLTEARKLADDARRLKRSGIDPIEDRRVQRQAKALDKAKTLTFRACVRAYIAAHSKGWRRPAHAKQWRATMETYAHPVVGDLPVQAIDVAFVLRVAEPIWTEKTATASRVRGRIEAVLDWATAHGYRQGDNPARWKGHLENLLAKRSKVHPVEHYVALPYAELGDFMVELRQQKDRQRAPSSS